MVQFSMYLQFLFLWFNRKTLSTIDSPVVLLKGKAHVEFVRNLVYILV